MSKDQDTMEMLGMITESLPGLTFKIEVDNGHEIKGKLSGKMRMHKISLMPGDWVKVELSPYNLNLGRITFRYNSKPDDAEFNK